MYTKIISILIIIGLILSLSSISTAINTNNSQNTTSLLNETNNTTPQNNTNNITNNTLKKLLTLYTQLDTIYVSNKGNDNNTGTDWNNSVATINTAAACVKEGGTIILDDGIYYPPPSYITKGCTIKSRNGPTKTIITSFTFDNSLHFYGTSFNIEGISFKNCTGYYGSAIKVLDCLLLKCDNCIFYNCQARNGGAINIMSSRSKGIFSNCVFQNCKATTDSGGVVANSGSSSFFNCNFTNNSAATNGGVIINDRDVTFTSSQFNYNTATRYGGVICNVASESHNDIIFESCDFIGNNATYGNIAYSGKIYDYQKLISSIIFNNSYFNPNTENNFAGNIINIININQILTKETNNNTNNTTPQNNTNNITIPTINNITLNPIIQPLYIYHHHDHTHTPIL